VDQRAGLAGQDCEEGLGGVHGQPHVGHKLLQDGVVHRDHQHLEQGAGLDYENFGEKEKGKDAVQHVYKEFDEFDDKEGNQQRIHQT
jgi:hypothetical protein